jgi:hypothetical protein
MAIHHPPLALVLSLATVVHASDESLKKNSPSLLKTLPTAYAKEQWRVFSENWKDGETPYSAFTKQLRRDEAGPMVVKVVARCRLPVRALLDTFQSEDQSEVAEWNPFAGEVTRLEDAIQLQTYRMPWPFSSREYLVRCTDHAKKDWHEAHCSSIDDHPRAPERPDRVRGVSETVWRFSEGKDGLTSIHLETLVDPRGVLPSWVTEQAGKSATVKIVQSLVKATSRRLSKATRRTADPAMASRAEGLEESPSSSRLWSAWAHVRRLMVG